MILARRYPFELLRRRRLEMTPAPLLLSQERKVSQVVVALPSDGGGIDHHLYPDGTIPHLRHQGVQPIGIAESLREKPLQHLQPRWGHVEHGHDDADHHQSQYDRLGLLQKLVAAERQEGNGPHDRKSRPEVLVSDPGDGSADLARQSGQKREPQRRGQGDDHDQKEREPAAGSGDLAPSLQRMSPAENHVANAGVDEDPFQEGHEQDDPQDAETENGSPSRGEQDFSAAHGHRRQDGAGPEKSNPLQGVG